MKELEGRTAVVTGAASGIGRAMAERFAAAGMNLVLGDVEMVPLQETEATVKQLGVDVVALHTDVRHLADVQAMRTAALDTYGRVDVVCNNAGVVGPFGVPIEMMTVEDWRWVLDVDLWGVIHGIQTFVPDLVAQGEGHVVNTASLAGLTTGSLINAAYHTAKHGVVALSECLYHDLQSRGSAVGVSVLCPGFVKTQISMDIRNRPEDTIPRGGLSNDDEQETRRAVLIELSAGGRPPSEVADLVHDAVVTGGFYIHTDEAALPFIRARHDAIQAASLPASGELEMLGEK